MTSGREVRHCTCGNSLTVRSTPAKPAADIARIFDEFHSGPGHEPTDARTAARVRKNEYPT